jgi:AraC-like DNA-binding protein
MTDRLPSARLLPGMVPDGELYDLWRHSISPYFHVEPTDPHGPQQLPLLKQYNLGSFMVVDTTFSGQKFRRDSLWMARHDDVDHLAVQLYVRGCNRVDNGGVSYTLDTANVYAVNLAYEVDTESEDSDTFTLVFPREWLASEIPHLTHSRGALFAPGSFSARIFMDHMLSLRRILPEARMTDMSAISLATQGLLDALVRHQDPEGGPGQGPTFQAMCRHIERGMEDMSLGVDSLCAHFRCSRSTVYRLFRAQGGVAAYIQRRRLLACFKALISPKQRHRRIFDIALDYGFNSPSHFSTLFRGHFGMTPKQARAADTMDGHRAVAPKASFGDTAEDQAEMMWNWAKTLRGEMPRRAI